MDNITILAVDDLKMNRDMLRISFCNDHKILEASSGEEAIALLKNNEVDIIITDIFMQPMSGYELIKRIREIPEYELTPIVAVTENDEASQNEAIEAGADNFICRPFVRGPLQQCVKLAVYKQALNKKVRALEASLETVKAEDQEEISRLEEKISEIQTENNAKTNFLSRVSHDMRTPLNGILGLTALMKDKVQDPDLLKDLSELELSGNFLLDLINDTLDISRIETGNFELHPVVCDGRSIFNNTVKLTKVNMRNKNIDFHVHADNLPFTILYIDAGRLQQAVMNILGNAAKFTPAGGRVDLTMRNISVDQDVIWDEIVIEDNGIGMSEEFLPQLFDPFSQANNAKTEVRQGTGLGMTLTKQALDMVGGTIAVESELGKGTKVTLTMPLKVASKEQIEEWKKEGTAHGEKVSLSGKRFLLCEDHPLNASIATRLLESRGGMVEHAENGLVGVQMFKESSESYYDLVLMDIRMPVLDGLEAAKAIRKLNRADAVNVPIVAMTANAFDSDIAETKRAGMNAHLRKPIQIDVMFRTIEKLLSVDGDIRKQKILVVDDIEMNRAVLISSLQDEYEMLEASNGREALEVLDTTNGIDLVITDVQMPEMDGTELVKGIRANKKFQHIAIIANTQYGSPDQEETMLALGANDFVYKPTTPKIVEIRVRNALKKI